MAEAPHLFEIWLPFLMVLPILAVKRTLRALDSAQDARLKQDTCHGDEATMTHLLAYPQQSNPSTYDRSIPECEDHRFEVDDHENSWKMAEARAPQRVLIGQGSHRAHLPWLAFQFVKYIMFFATQLSVVQETAWGPSMRANMRWVFDGRHYQTRPHMAPFLYPYCPQLPLVVLHAAPSVCLLAYGAMLLAELLRRPRLCSAVATFYVVLSLECVLLDDIFIQPDITYEIIFVIALARGAACGQPDEWCTTRFWFACFYGLGAGVCKLHLGLVFSGGMQRTAVCILPLGELGWKVATFGASTTLSRIGAELESNPPQSAAANWAST